MSTTIDGTLGLVGSTTQGNHTKVNLLRTDLIGDLQNQNKFLTTKFTSTSIFIRQSNVFISSDAYQVGTTWVLGPTWSGALINCLPDSRVKLYYIMPARNNSGSWGGMYIEPQIQFNNNSWLSLGSSGHTGGVMMLRNQAIGSFDNFYLITPPSPVNQEPFNVSIRFYFRTHDGGPSVYEGVNTAHSINSTSGTASLLPNTPELNNPFQHYPSIIIQELARFQQLT